MSTLVGFVRDVVGLAANLLRVALVIGLGLLLPVALVAVWVDEHRAGRGVDEPLHSASVVLFAVVGLVWLGRVANWFFPPPAVPALEAPPWER